MIKLIHILSASLRARFLMAGGVVCCVFLAACGGSSSPSPAGQAVVLARVGDVKILSTDLEAEIQRRIARGQPTPDTGALLETMVQRQTLIDQARKAGFEEDPEFRRAYENLLIGRFKEKDLRPDLAMVEVSDEEIARSYDQNKSRYTRPGKARLAILMLSAGATTKESIRARMKEALELAEKQDVSVKGFGPLAIRYSEDQSSRYKGGDIGWFDEGRDYRWPTEILKAGFELRKNAVSDLIEVDKDFYLVRKLDERPASTTPLKSVATQIRRELLSQKHKEVETAFYESLRETAGVTIWRDRLESFEHLANTGKASSPPKPPSFP